MRTSFFVEISQVLNCSFNLVLIDDKDLVDVLQLLQELGPVGFRHDLFHFLESQRILGANVFLVDQGKELVKHASVSRTTKYPTMCDCSWVSFCRIMSRYTANTRSTSCKRTSMFFRPVVP